MLQNIRDKSHGIVVKIIVGFIVVTFALFGVDALVTGFNSSDTVAEVNGTEITRTDLLQAAETQRRQLISMMGNNINPALLEDTLLQRRALDELIQRAVLTNNAESLNLGVSDAQVDQYLLQAGEFQTDGRFDQNKYVNFVRSLGYTPLSFKERIKTDVLLQQARSAIVASEFVVPHQVDMIKTLQNQTRTFDYVEFDLASETEQMDVTDAEIETYFSAHPEEFKQEEQVSLDYVLIKSTDLRDRIDVTDAELKAAYDSEVALERSEERQVSHILLELGDDRTEDQANALVTEIQQQIASGKSFASLAETYSDDLGSKSSGGNLGYIEKGIMGDDFDDAVFNMALGEVKSVQTDFGLHLVQLNDIATVDVASFDEMKLQLEEQIVSRKIEDALLDEHENIADLAYASDRLEPLAKEYGVEIETTALFGRSGGNDELTVNPQIVAAAYSAQVLEDGQNSNLIEINDNEVIVVRVKDHNPESLQSLDDAREQVASVLIEEKAVASLKAKADLAFSDLDNQDWKTVTAAARGESAISELAFTLPHPVDAPVTEVKPLSNGNLVLMRLTAVESQDVEGDDEQVSLYERYLNQTNSTLSTQAQQSLLSNAATIER
ncbi:SurA N-terminal domain-containing protein [Marinomonas sp. 15G1-11]|uniref:Periplasmic chaperone PpiD n=1 Tax=Marinomonas phaeophyticola TaxID=3004091 RepID=A0ABT4JWS8_9GAMM|nr:SurA N-terminal domain-containing protein [Marinomonas sp. 15G1-11]MCZ2722810.1 SurA N-terminal domain-containing protein [Marinomonas sp. 15G1-11]